MKRALIVSTALAVLVTASCSSDGPDQSTRTSDSRPTPSTLATATGSTDPPDPTDPTNTTEPTDPVVTTPGGNGQFGFARLSFFGDCAELLTYMQTEARERVTAWGLDGGYYYGRGVPDMLAPEATAAAADSAGGDFSRVEAPSVAQDVDFSGTNTQEVGVDEG
jgi:hypothetical protein